VQQLEALADVEEEDNMTDDNGNEVGGYRHDTVVVGGKGKGTSRSLPLNKRMVIAAILFIAGIVVGWIGVSMAISPSQITDITGASSTSTATGIDIGASAAAEKVVEFLDSRLEPTYPGIEVVSDRVTESTNMPDTYEVMITMTFQNQPQSTLYHVSKDGNWMFGGLLDLNEELPDVAPPAPSGDGGDSGTVVDMAEVMDDDAVKGDPDAPVTIVEFSDFECPFCTRFFTQTLPAITEQYIDTGKVKFIYRDFPLSFHPNAQKAAEAAECAEDQGKFWEMHDMLFEKGVGGGTDSFKQFAIDLGVDSAAFDECLDTGKYAEEVQKDLADGSRLGVSGTPGFFINGQYVSGAQPFEVFQQVIEQELGGG
jgi:protein-disulfide isomerase